jgi:DNA-binding MarR family transcriptional regulator
VGTEVELVDDVAGAVMASVRLLVQRLRQSPAIPDDVTSSESSALARLHRVGPTTAAELARLERISPQSMGATMIGLETRGLVHRASDPGDERRFIIALTEEGDEVVRRRRKARNDVLAHALANRFSEEELLQLRAATPLLERIAHSL